MNRSALILIGALALGAAIFAGAYVATRHATVKCCADPADDLSWLRTEFHLNDAEMARIRKLHEGYLPQCAEVCAKIAAKKNELDSLPGTGANYTAAAQAKLNEIAALRAQCQAQMLRHFIAVSQALPPEQGRRYLAEMKRITLDQHGQMEQSMPGDTGHEHHH
jgi:heme A synthase